MSSKENFPGSEPLVIDVRSRGEYAGGFFPNAINIPVDEIEGRIGDLGDRDREITLYCASGARSGMAQGILQRYNFTNLTNGGGYFQMMEKVK